MARNESATIRECLNSLLTQNSPLDEVLMYDDASTDRTRELADEIARSHSKLKVFSSPDDPAIKSPKKRALADGFAKASCELVALTDADCVVPAKWNDAMAAEFDEKTGAVIGASWPLEKNSLVERVYRWERLTANTLMASACGWGYPASACGHSIFYMRRALLDVNAPVHREIPSGDDDLTVQAIARQGYSVRFCASAESVVRDLGGLRGSRWNQAARHQSVTHLYPLRWRILFAASIVANVVALSALVLVPFVESKLFIVEVLAGKLIMDGFAGVLLTQRLKLDIGAVEIFCASLLLPVWTLWRTIAALFGKKYVWRGRSVNAQSLAVSIPSTHGS